MIVDEVVPDEIAYDLFGIKTAFQILSFIEGSDGPDQTDLIFFADRCFVVAEDVRI